MFKISFRKNSQSDFSNSNVRFPTLLPPPPPPNEIESTITRAVNAADSAWNKNEELRKLFGSLKTGTYKFLGGENVGAFLQLTHKKRQIIHFVPPNPKDGMLAHAVLDASDYYNTPTRKFAPRETILVSNYFVSKNIKHNVTFINATPNEIHSVSEDQMRGLILLHEARHLFKLQGHGNDPSTYDGQWNDYILWTGFLGQKIAW